MQPKLPPAEVVEILDRVLAGEASPEEIARLQAYKSPQRVEAVLRNAGRYAVLPGDDAQLERSAPSWEAMLERIGHASTPIPSHAKPINRLRLQTWLTRSRAHRRQWPVFLAVAVVIGVIATSIPMLWSRQHERKAAGVMTYTTGRGQQATVELSDGSTATLAPDTRVTYTVDRAGARSVQLVGEAFFIISHAIGQPFVVHTGSATTRVLGTAFDVRRYPNESFTEVTVVNGRVAAGGRTGSAVLSAGMIGRVTDSTIVSERVKDSTRMSLWTDGNLVFNHTPVSVVLATLSRWYDYEFRLTDTTLAKRSISAEFRTNQAAETMAALRIVLGVTMTFDGKIVTLNPTKDGAVPRRQSIRGSFNHSDLEVGK